MNAIEMLKKIVRRVPGSRAARRQAQATLELARVARQFVRFRDRSRSERPEFVPQWHERLFMLGNRTAYTPFDRHYVYHTAWAVRQLQRNKPHEHVDVSSAIYFVALGSAIVPIRHFDFRPPQLELNNVTCEAGDVTRLPLADRSVASLSCMHVLEHIGLGRYGDPLDPQGDAKGAAELQRVLAPGGRLLFVTPVGRPRVAFNAHRIYNFEMVRELFASLTLKEWSLVPDDPQQGLVEGAPRELIDAQSYGCGCFVFERAADDAVTLP